MCATRLRRPPLHALRSGALLSIKFRGSAWRRRGQFHRHKEPENPMWQIPFGSVRRILCLGAHSDDIEIGAGGTLLKLAAEIPDLEIQWVVFSAPGLRAEEARRSADDFLG